MIKYRCRENIGIKNIAEVKREILALFNRKEDLAFDLSEVRRIDMSVAQLMIAAMKEGQSRGIRIAIAGISPEIRKQLVYCGIVKDREAL